MDNKIKKYNFYEFIKSDRSFSDKKLDFYGEDSPLDFNGQKEFLSKYVQSLKNIYGKNILNEKAVSTEEIESAKKQIIQDDNVFSAYSRKSCTKYKGLHLYTKRASVSNNTVVLKDNYTFPLPCAKYEFDFGVKKLSLQVKIDKEYYHTSPEGILATTTGRFIELRKGTQEIIKLYFSPDGRFCYKNGKVKPYHYDLTVIDNYKFNEINEISVSLFDEYFILLFNGKENKFEYTVNEKPDNIFLGGGMQPVSNWEITFKEFIDENNNKIDIFEKSDIKSKPQYIGEVKLPFGIGTYKNKDRELILSKSIVYNGDENVILHVGALDPGGSVNVNGKKVFDIDTFSPFYLDITKNLKIGDNKLDITVDPRAPESLFPWHKNNDYYNAWFANNVDIIKTKTGYAVDIKCFTNKIKNGTHFTVLLKPTHGTLKGANYKLYIKKSFPDSGKKILIDGGVFDKNTYKKQFFYNVDLWSTETPNLYDIVLEIVSDKQTLYSASVQTGFRLIEQKNGGIYLNGKKILLKGALNMQFLPPIDKVPITHLCPTDSEIIEQVLALKKMNGNIMRLHQLGYGSNDRRFYSICDKLGIMLIATTRLIDSAENMQWTSDFKQKEEYQKQINYAINHPSIIMWEGSNELHTTIDIVDRIYDNFVDTVKGVDRSRLICPVSHLYYGGGIYDLGCNYYTQNGHSDEKGNKKESSYGWKDKSVVRSAHTYSLLLGYGAPWSLMKSQGWKWQQELLDDKEKAYLVSEYAIIGRQNPNTKESKKYNNKNSYEFGDERSALGNCFTDDEWELSQGFQALCALNANKKLLSIGADGLIWCCLSGGANNGSYLKPLIDFYGYKKLVYYVMRESFMGTVAFNENTDVLFNDGYNLSPIACGLEKGKRYDLTIDISNEKECVYKVGTKFLAKSDVKRFNKLKLSLKDGYYIVKYTVEEEDD